MNQESFELLIEKISNLKELIDTTNERVESLEKKVSDLEKRQGKYENRTTELKVILEYMKKESEENSKKIEKMYEIITSKKEDSFNSWLKNSMIKIIDALLVSGIIIGLFLLVFQKVGV